VSAQVTVERATGSMVDHLESVWVAETFRGETIWAGTVEVYRVLIPPPDRAYGWAVQSAKKPEEPEYVAVLGTGPIDSPLAAVRAWIVSEARKEAKP